MQHSDQNVLLLLLLLRSGRKRSNSTTLIYISRELQNSDQSTVSAVEESAAAAAACPDPIVVTILSRLSKLLACASCTSREKEIKIVSLHLHYGCCRRRLLFRSLVLYVSRPGSGENRTYTGRELFLITTIVFTHQSIDFINKLTYLKRVNHDQSDIDTPRLKNKHCQWYSNPWLDTSTLSTLSSSVRLTTFGRESLEFMLVIKFYGLLTPSFMHPYIHIHNISLLAGCPGGKN